jgi:hypothetical protein
MLWFSQSCIYTPCDTVSVHVPCLNMWLCFFAMWDAIGGELLPRKLTTAQRPSQLAQRAEKGKEQKHAADLPKANEEKTKSKLEQVARTKIIKYGEKQGNTDRKQEWHITWHITFASLPLLEFMCFTPNKKQFMSTLETLQGWRWQPRTSCCFAVLDYLCSYSIHLHRVLS